MPNLFDYAFEQGRRAYDLVLTGAIDSLSQLHENLRDPKKAKQKFKEHVAWSLGYITVSTPLRAGLENLLIPGLKCVPGVGDALDYFGVDGLSNEFTTGSRTTGAITTFLFLHPSRNLSKNAFMSKNSSEEEKEKHDTWFSVWSMLLRAPLHYGITLLGTAAATGNSSFDWKDIAAQVVIQTGGYYLTGKKIHWAADVSRYLAGIDKKPIRKVPDNMLDMGKRKKLALLGASAFLSLGLTNGVYKITELIDAHLSSKSQITASQGVNDRFIDDKVTTNR
jgi:hypothetical protein